MEDLLKPIAKLRRLFPTIGRVLNYCRFGLVIVLAGGAGLALTDQGHEISLRVTDDLGHAIGFFLAFFLWASPSRFWARRVVDSRFGADRGNTGFERWLVNHVPRIIGAGAYQGICWYR